MGETIFGLANLPTGSGNLIREALNLAGKGVLWFLHWIEQPGHFDALMRICAEAAAGNYAQAVRDLANLFLQPQ